MKKLFLNISILLPMLLGTAKMGAQVSIGADKAPHSSSVLELVAQYKSGTVGGLRLPQMTTDQRNGLGDLTSISEAFGLMIYNTDINCVEFWNSVKWVSFCEGEIPPIPPSYLFVDPTDYFFMYNESGVAKIFTVSTDQSSWSYVVDDPNGYFTVSDVGNTLEVYPNTPNNDGVDHTISITVSAGTATPVTVYVTHAFNGGGIGTPLPNTYVGAFWRYNQTGERIIRISGIASGNDGDWTASVAWMDGGWSDGDIVLDTDSLSTTALASRFIDFGAVIDSSFITDAEPYKVNGSAQSVSGTVESGGTIIFRIGLKSNWTSATAKPRYALVVLRYNNNAQTQKIFLRQGEGADNVSTTGTHANIKWSPYNVGDYYNQTYYGGYTSIVDFPTKAGFLYQWSYGTSPTTPRPYPPQDNVLPLSPPWSNATSGTTVCTFAPACPTGYRAPSNTEQASLLLSGTGTNNIKGYYADGFFDRRQEVSWGVSRNNDDVAYRGFLVFNPTTNASLFLPDAGYRYSSVSDNGTLMSTGLDGYYWSITGMGAGDGRAYQINTYNGGGQGLNIRALGFSVRCIAN